MNLLEAIQKSAGFLARKGVESPRLQAELLLAALLKLPRMKLYLNFERALTPAETEVLREWVRRRGQHEPLQYIIGSTSFCGLELAVNPQVLVPRPETELLAEQGWTFLNGLSSATQPAHEESARSSGLGTPMALDFGTGSGCVALALAVHCPQAEVYAVDSSAEALVVARQNASGHGLELRLHFLEGDGFGAIPAGLQFNLVISNPPYIPTGDIAQLQAEVRDYEPRAALDGGPDGLDYYRRLAAQAKPFLACAGRLMAEFGDGQAQSVSEIFSAQNWIVEQVLSDYTQRPRILIARPTGAS
ncbi:MAG TPA: peptide chain release factor N(5)-glutamine methyltransferase [Verrucomicrobiae bacterium]|nr:peptide chain release factor N(5)-glutamine methyltransferase [Verrucomicrobiae bacterium]